MSKIVQAVNAMLSNPYLISDVASAGGEFFFVYKIKYAWSMKKDGADYFLWYYPSSDLDELLSRAAQEYWDDINMVVYKSAEIGTREARASFSELFTLLTEREYGINDVLDDIISDGDPF